MIRKLRVWACVLVLFILGGTVSYGQAPVANFSSNISSGCTPIVVQFTDQSTGAPTSWVWDLGNGTTTTLQNPSTTYVTAGSYTVVLTATNASGSNTKTVVSYITTTPSPTVAFTASDVTPACSSKTVVFTNQSAPNAPGATSYYWDFGDGTTGTATSPSHTYTTPGTYSVSLVVTNGVGCNQVLTKNSYITVLPKPVAAFTASNNNSCTSPVTATFTNSSAGGSSYSWDFGDGGTSTAASPSHTYTAAGSYTVRLITVSAAGCADTVIRPATVNIGSLTAGFTMSMATACTRNAVAFTNTTTPSAGNSTWYFGDGATSTVANPTHAYTTAGTYTVKLVVNYNNCADSATRTITITSGAATAFSGSPLTDCKAPLTTTFTNTTTGGVSYLWLFGDGGTSTAVSPSHTYTALGSYNVTLISTSANGCTDTLVKPAYVTLVPPTAVITFNGSDGGCIPLSKTFTANVTSAQPVTGYTWNFGDGGTGTGSTASHTYTVAGNFIITLTYTTIGGCTGTATTTISAGPHATLAYNANPTTVCVGSPVTFTNASMGGAVYTWNFGDGGTSSAYSPTYAYSAPGVYTVTLTSNTNQCYDVLTKVNLITVQPPLADFTTAYSCTAQLVYQFTNTSIGATSYLWDFGDGQTSTSPSPGHTYAVTGNYTVTLTAYNSATGCSNTKTLTLGVKPVQAQFTASPLTVCAKTETTFTIPADAGLSSWVMSFGDGVTTAVTPGTFGHTYNTPGTYTVKLVVTNSNGCKDSLIHSNYITVSGPTAGFTASSVSGCSPVTLTLTNTSVASSASPVSSVRWDFGDGTFSTSSASTVSHTYTASGSYAVTLVVTDGNGCKDSLTRTNYITVSKPVAAFSADTTGCVGRVVAFTNGSTGNGVLSYGWTFGDGGTSTAASPVHAYAASGAYSVRLIVTDANGCKDTLTRASYIKIGSVTAGFTTTDTLGFCPPYTVNLTNTSAGAASYLWDFGNGNTSIATSPTVLYAVPGIYTITLKTTGASGCMDSIKKIIRVNATPVGSFTYTPMGGCAPLTVTFTATTNGASSLIWDFNNGVILTGTGNTITYTFTQGGKFIPKLILNNSNGCNLAISGVDSIKVNKITAGFTLNPNPVCVGVPVSFTDTSKTITSPVITRNWSFGDATTGTGINPAHTYTTAGTYTVRLIAGDAGGCADTAYHTVTINPLPVITAVNAAICAGDSIQLHAGTDNYSWSPATGLSCSNCANPYAKPLAITTYLINATTALECTATKAITITVNPVPVVTAGSAQTICIGATTQLQATGAAGYTWTPAIGLTSTSIANPIAGPLTTTTYTVTGTTAAGCSSTAQVTVTVVPKPVFTHTLFQEVCAGSPVTLSITGPDTYAWSPAAGLNTTTGNMVIAQPAFTTTYTITATGPNGCTRTDTVTVKVNPLPPVNAGPDQTICAGQDAQLQASGATAYSWSPAGSLSCGNCPSPLAQPPVSTVYLVVGTDPHGCIDSDRVTITLISHDSVSVSPGKEICLGDSVQLMAAGGTAYSWSPAATLSNSSSANPVAKPGATTTYRVLISQGTCFVDTLTTTVTVHPIPAVDIGPDQKVLAGTPVRLNPAVTNVTTYTWSPADDLSCTTCPDPVATPAKTITYTLNVASDFGCTASDDITLFVACDGKQLWLPNTFTPNADGQNDRFYPHGRGINIVKRFRIYDRWGELVFDRTNLPVDDDSYGWDGTYKNQSLKPDVYVYIINAECITGEPLEIKGDISLIR